MPHDSIIALESIQRTLTCFYQMARHDVLIGYHFDHIANWQEHLDHTRNFWQIQLLVRDQKISMQESAGLLINKHEKLKIKKGQLDRWVILFTRALDESLQSENEIELKELWQRKIVHFKKVFKNQERLWQHD